MWLYLILARLSFSYLCTACNILIQRVFGTISSRVLIYLFYFLSVAVMAAPGAVVALLIDNTGWILLSDYILPFLAITVCNVLLSLLLIYLCRDVLKYAELK
ncbi:MAG: putative ABC exporter domain-containing protein [Clostridia bacterium]